MPSMSVYEQNGVEYTIDDPTVAGVFLENVDYPAGAYVKIGGGLWRFTTAHPAGAWIGTDAVSVDVCSEIKNLNKKANDLRNDVINYNSFNALELMNTDSVTDNGITFTHNDDSSVSISGTSSGAAWMRYCYGARPEYIIPGQKYIMSLDSAYDYVNLRLYWYVETTLDTRISMDNVDGTGEKEVTVPSNCNGLVAILVVQEGHTVTETVHPVVMLGKTNYELTELTNQLINRAYMTRDVSEDGFISTDGQGEYVDIDDLIEPGTYIMETSLRKVNAPPITINCVRTEPYGYGGTVNFIKQTAFNITATGNNTTVAINGTEYIRYRKLSGFTAWMPNVNIGTQAELYHSTKNYNAFDVLFPLLYANTTSSHGLDFEWADDGSCHVHGTSDGESANNELYRGSLPNDIVAGETYYAKMDSTIDNLTFRIYFYDSEWSADTRVTYFITSDTTISVPASAENLILRIAYSGSGEAEAVDETVHPAILTRQPSAPTINNNTFNYTVHNDSYTVTASPTIQASSDLYLAATGTTDDRTADIMTLLQTQKVCKLGVGDFYITTGIAMPDGTSIIGCGRGTKLILSDSVTEGYTISVGTYCSVQDLIVSGGSDLPYEDYTVGGRDGIVLLGDRTGFEGDGTFSHNFAKLSNLWIENFNGSGVKAYRNDGAASFLAENIDILRCGVGVNIALFSEFHAWTNIRCRWCVYACIMNGGNNLFSNCHWDACIHLLLIDNSLGNLVNDTHSSFTNCTFCHANHNTGNAIELINVKNGLVFSNCQIFYSKIVMTDTNGVVISGFNFGNSEQIIMTRCNGINISNCIFGTAPSVTKTDVAGLIFTNNMTRGGVVVTD